MSDSQSLKKIPLPRRVQEDLVIHGGGLTADAVRKFQEKLDAKSDDIELGLQLLGYYALHRHARPEFQKPYVELAHWLVCDYPESDAHAMVDVAPELDSCGYESVKTAWCRQVSIHPDRPKVLSNAARFVARSEPNLAIERLQQAQALAPEDANIASRLGQVYRGKYRAATAVTRMEMAQKALEQFEFALSLNEGSAGEASALDSVAKAAYSAGKLEKAKAYADRLLTYGGDDSTKWYSGNATHHANLILGRLELQLGNIETAGEYLLAAGRTSGSPQLNSFGPNMSLAKELLEQDQRDVVLQYFKLCKTFWKNDQLQSWTVTVKEEGIPAFGGNLRY